MKSRIHSENPYTSLSDGHSALDEYYKLKDMLILTKEEEQLLRDCMTSDRIFIGGFYGKYK